MISEIIRNAAFGMYHNLPISAGTPVFEEDWDILIILDACRPDVLQSVLPEVAISPDSSTIKTSVGSNSVEWMESTFDETGAKALTDTAYVTGNPFSGDYAPSSLGLLDEVWRYAWDDERGVMPAQPITDRAITTIRQQSYERYIIHYMQPHFPSIPSPISEGKSLDEWGEQQMSVWEAIEEDSVTVADAKGAYQDNLKYVLNNVEILLENVDSSSVVISADHGEAFGEWGLYGHGSEPAPVLRRVPWVQVTATNEKTHEPDTYDRSSVETSIEHQLDALGYR